MSDSSTLDRVYPFIGRHRGHQAAVVIAALLPLTLLAFGIVWAWGWGVTWLDLALLFVFQGIAGLGITVGYHRLLAHGAFKAPKVVRGILLVMGLSALQGSPASWAATHRRHHAAADRPGDPHSPLEGFWHAHFGWLPKGNLVHSGPGHEKLMADPVVAFLERTQWFWLVGSLLAPGFVALAITGGSWGAFASASLWAGGVRVLLVHHVTWSINSVCHVWGTRPYTTTDQARNNVIFGLLGFGEGWHNNHHAHPRSAYLGHRWYQIDAGGYLVRTLKLLGLAKDVQRPPVASARSRDTTAATS
ncbi:MAG: acyl-CoA desaturase [Thermoplasmatota archaeon]